MRRDIEMQITTIINIFKNHAPIEYVGVYISTLEKENLPTPEIIFSLDKLAEFCQSDSTWESEFYEILNIKEKISEMSESEITKEKSEAPVNRFWISFREWMNKELPQKGLLYSHFMQYDNWDGGTYYLNIDFDNFFRLNLGMPYDKRFDSDKCSFTNIKLLIELMYRELIKVESRYAFTVEINKMFARFSLAYELKGGRVTTKGYKTSNVNSKIIDYQMFESKIQWAEDKILGNEGLDKHTALNYITDALQYLLSIIKNLEHEDFDEKRIAQRCGLLACTDANSKEYAVIVEEINKIQIIANEYFDIRHNEYLSKVLKTTREPLTDNLFIEYLFNRIYGLVYFMKSKYLIFNSNLKE